MSPVAAIAAPANASHKMKKRIMNLRKGCI